VGRVSGSSGWISFLRPESPCLLRVAGLTMVCIWSVGAMASGIALHAKRTNTLVVRVLVFSHWIVDFITQPMVRRFPGRLSYESVLRRVAGDRRIGCTIPPWS